MTVQGDSKMYDNPMNLIDGRGNGLTLPEKHPHWKMYIPGAQVANLK